jgi:hypothetical protein
MARHRVLHLLLLIGAQPELLQAAHHAEAPMAVLAEPALPSGPTLREHLCCSNQGRDAQQRRPDDCVSP